MRNIENKESLTKDKELPKVEGRSYTSNVSKMLKHLDKIKVIQDKGVPSPVMLHISIINACNLTCSFCCFANRNLKDRLSIEEIKKALKSFRELGTLGVEFTGGGEPTLHPDINEAISYASGLGYKIGICTNGSKLSNVNVWDKVTWARLGMYGFAEGYSYDLSALRSSGVDISAAYVWDQNTASSINPNLSGDFDNKKGKLLAKNRQNEQSFEKMLDWVEENEIPTRIAINAIKNESDANKDMAYLDNFFKHRKTKYAFLSDFNFKTKRSSHNCYMHMIKPFLFTDGNVYACPSLELAPENNHNMRGEFKICSIDDIKETYSEGVTIREHECSYCKYSMQNELMDEVMRETEHNEFA